ncbi:MAG: hypothetical protein AAFX50_04185, partial [Acidobacteriota bacterium]
RFWRGRSVAKIWNVDEQPVEIAAEVSRSRILEASLSPSKRILATWDRDNLRFWDSIDGTPLTPKLKSPAILDTSRGRGRKKWGCNGKVFAALGENGVLLWRPEGAELELYREVDFRTGGLEFSRDCKRVLAWGRKGQHPNGTPQELVALVWGLESSLSKEQVWVKKNAQTSSGWEGATFVGESQRVVLWGGAGLSAWDFATDSPKQEVEAKITGGTLIEGGQELVTWGTHQVVRWDLNEMLPSTLWRDSDYVHGVRLSQEQGLALLFLQGRGPEVRDLRDWRTVLSLYEEGDSPSFEDQGRLVFFRDKLGGMRFLDSRTGLPWGKPNFHWGSLSKESKYPFSTVKAIVDEKARHLVSWSNDGLIRIWDLGVAFDVPDSHLPLMVEAKTGTTLDKFGRIEILPAHEWWTRRRHYLRLASEHTKGTSLPINLPSQECRAQAIHESPKSGTDSKLLTGYTVPFYSVY